MADTDLAAALASRICHDLVSPVGAVVNGVDLLREMGPEDWSDAVGMVGQSAARASVLLQLYRLAFGAAAADAQPVARRALRELASVLGQPPRVALEWNGSGPAMPRREARLSALLLLCARSALGMRGVIHMTMAEAATCPMTVTVEAEAFAQGAEAVELLTAPRLEEPSPRTVEFVLAREAAAALGVALRVERGAGRLAITAG